MSGWGWVAAAAGAAWIAGSMSSYESQKELNEQYKIAAKQAEAQAEAQKAQAENILLTAQETIEEGTQTRNELIDEFNQQQGENMLQIGGSSIEFVGSAKSFIESNYTAMSEDLYQLTSNIESQWTRLMQERTSDIVSAESYLDIAEDYRDRIKSGDEMFWDSLLEGGLNMGSNLFAWLA